MYVNKNLLNAYFIMGSRLYMKRWNERCLPKTPTQYSAGVLLVDTPQGSGDRIERCSVKIESLSYCEHLDKISK